jgi:hypothetical protein
MKQQLLERLKLMDNAILDQSQKLAQANADLNMLNGCRQELMHIISLHDSTKSDDEIGCLKADFAPSETLNSESTEVTEETTA